jgi:hypothetical protein
MTASSKEGSGILRHPKLPLDQLSMASGGYQGLSKIHPVQNSREPLE